MPKCVPCIAPEVKDFIRETYTGKAVAKLLDSIEDCGKEPVRFCPSKGRGGREKRAPSEYNLFIKECLSTKNLKGKGFGAAAPFMKECAVQWRQQQKKK